MRKADQWDLRSPYQLVQKTITGAITVSMSIIATLKYKDSGKNIVHWGKWEQ